MLESWLPGSEEELSEWLWEEFEKFALSALRRHYGIVDVLVGDRRTRGESGREGNAAYVIARGQSSIDSKLWVEIAKRSSTDLDIEDVAGHVVMAYLAEVNRLIFVTNTRFSEFLRYAIEDFAYRTGLQCTLMTGAELLEVARRTGALAERDTRGPDPSANAAPDAAGMVTAQEGDPVVLEVRTSFSNRMDRPQHGTEASELQVHPGAPVYMVVETAVTRCFGQHEVELSTTCRTDGITLAPRHGPGMTRVGLGDRFRSVYAVVVERPGLYSADDFVIHAQPAGGGVEVRVNVLPGGQVRVLPQLLADWLAPTRQPAEEEAARAVRRFLSGTRFESIGVIAPAGAGKTHLVHRLRRQWVDAGVHEVSLDGSLEKSDQELALSLLRSLVPVEPATFRLDEAAVAQMLSRLGVPAPLARRGAELLSPLAAGGLHASVRELGQLLALVLAARSERQPVVVMLDDLHKASASTLALLQELLDGLRRLGKGRVMVVFASRDVPGRQESDLDGIWEQHIRELCGEQTTVVKLASLEPAEAVQLLRASVPTLEEHQAAAIIEQVGRTPFVLREALALLRDAGALVYEELLGQHVLVRPDELQETLDKHELREPTLHRLRILRGRMSTAAWDLLEGAACLGKFFDVEAAAPPGVALDEAYAAIEAFQRLEILTARGLRASQAAFDHDLIRRVVLQQMGPVRQRRVAGQLYPRVAREGAEPALAASLAYQAGLAAECYEHARTLARETGRRGRPADAASALGMAITVVDENLAQKVVNLSARTRGNVDDAVAAAAPCTIAEWPSSRRQQELLTLLMEYIGFLSAVTGTGSRVLEEALTEAEMLAVARRDLFRRAQLVAYRGRQDFNVDRFESSVRWHRQADEMLRQVPDAPAVRTARADNLHRLATGLRQLTLRDEARAVLRQALRLRAGADWSLLLRVLSSSGATYFQSDWARVRHFWERAERVAERRDRPERLVHSLIDVAHLDLLEDRHDAAHERLLRAEAIAEDRGYENSLLRVHLNLGCLHLVQGEYAAARHHLLTAEQLGVANRIPRRLWRVRANLATLYEAMGNEAQAYTWDAAMLSGFELLPAAGGMTERDREASLSNTRKVLALANLFLRADESPLYARHVEPLDDFVRQVGTQIADAIRAGRTDLPGLRDRHCKQIGSRRRFIITE